MKHSGASSLEPLYAEFPHLRGFLGPFQAASILHGLRGNSAQTLRRVLEGLSSTIRDMPTCLNDGGVSKLAYLRYRCGNYEFLLTAKDPGCEGDRPEDFQSQAYGYARFLPYRGEFGYVSLPEILGGGAQMDLSFVPMPLDEARTD